MCIAASLGDVRTVCSGIAPVRATRSYVRDAVDPVMLAPDTSGPRDGVTNAEGPVVDRLVPWFFPGGDDFRGPHVHQVRLLGGDASSDSDCYVD
jgi:hypothetical protein